MLVRISHGDSELNLDIDPGWNVLFVKQRACQILQLRFDEYDLLLNHRRLEEDGRFTEYQVNDGKEVNLELARREIRNRFFIYCYSCDSITPALLSFICETCEKPQFRARSISENRSNATGNCCDTTCPSTRGRVKFLCLKMPSHEPAVLLDQIRRNLELVPCVACFNEDRDILVRFCEAQNHALCIDCFKAYAQEYLESGLFQLVPEFGFTLGCPAGCRNAFITDPHHFRILGSEFYSRYKEFSASSFFFYPGTMSAGAVRAPLIIPLRPPVPGVPKSHIDTNTRLEIMSETPNVYIYFTINGNKPTIQKTDRELLKTGTYKFRTPFTLPAGTQIVRAIAFLPDTGSESNIVTKRFDVVKADVVEGDGNTPLPDDYGFLEDLKAIESHRKSHSVRGCPRDTHRVSHTRRGWANAAITRSRTCKVSSHEALTSFQNITALQLALETMDGIMAGQQNPQSNNRDIWVRLEVAQCPPDPSVQFARLQRITDVLRCPHCFTPRPLTQAQNFCVHCGHSLPALPTPLASDSNNTRLGHCSACGSNIPLNFPSCPVCENRLHPTPESEGAEEYRLCTVCGTLNPCNVTSCLTCEARVDSGRQNLVYSSRQTHPSRSPTLITSVHSDGLNSMRPENGTHILRCPHCQRKNNPDARFCDRCGLETVGLLQTSHPRHVEKGFSPPWSGPSCFPKEKYVSGVASIKHGYPPIGDGVQSHDNSVVPISAGQFSHCVRCGNKLTPDASFCSRCGSHLEIPTRDPMWKSLSERSFLASEPFLSNDSNQPVSNKPRHTVVSNVATQTVGLFFPSSADLRRKQILVQPQPDATQPRERTPLLKAISPGRGFWRKQLDHIIAHLKVYTNNNPEFRVAIGEPRMGKVWGRIISYCLYYHGIVSKKSYVVRTRYLVTPQALLCGLLSADLTEAGGCATVTLIYSLPQSNSTGPAAWNQRLNSANSNFSDGTGQELHNQKLRRHSLRAAQESWTNSDRFSLRSEEDNESETNIATLRDTRNISQQRLFRKHVRQDDDENDAVTSPKPARQDVCSPSLDRTVSSDLEVENFEPFVTDKAPGYSEDTRSQKKGTKVTSNAAAELGFEVTRSNQLNGNRRVKSAKKSATSKRSKRSTEATPHHGEAGIALLRQSKLTIMDRNLIENLSKPNDEAGTDNIRRLLEEGANPNCTDLDGRTPLMLAVHNRRVEAIPILIEAGAKPNSPGLSNGNTPLHEAVLSGFDGVELVDALLRCGASPKVKNKRQETPHSLALRMNCEPISRLFLVQMGQTELQKLTEETTRLNVKDTEVDNL
ncbi:ankyrin repeat-containing protein C20orf12 homolog [Clonorchis sinensis]|uniref:Ankyrin repeat-containing protein C20orf12 homolog n=1 Tax=Clonorchis sinensis TaxID=79923 RepID=G7YME6_CLOSI|nr:ankyrin repeat-containing protein C20orf12 homolog [Clonorchis sinensis]